MTHHPGRQPIRSYSLGAKPRSTNTKINAATNKKLMRSQRAARATPGQLVASGATGRTR